MTMPEPFSPVALGVFVDKVIAERDEARACARALALAYADLALTISDDTRRVPVELGQALAYPVKP